MSIRTDLSQPTTQEPAPERLVKSSDRVRDLGEVFTPANTVKDMLDMLPATMWAIHPSPTFLEPACGDGNFLIAILERKLDAVAKAHHQNELPAGPTTEAVLFHALEALAAIYAVDISTENIIGGTPGHEIGARTRLLTGFSTWSLRQLDKRLTDRSPAMRAAAWIVEHNIVVGNMLPTDANGHPTGRSSIPILEYTFSPEHLSLAVRRTTLGEVIDTALAATSDELQLFGPSEPQDYWQGAAFQLHRAHHIEAPNLTGPVRNGHVRQP